ncbi:hypothetical protein BIU82_04300 [Arthrobacter sp. SW1]|uniref:carboxypeptidase regulatory-like domain-containing protein n=1 Tax=Arthrobacter sp. SW1 TaxID=1920889 RepID=UPI000877DE8E|nr:carboxypeptidase regulatory-like domain-containing protein [Arthrobacter sp. SW1]OFI38547.1 hypothetical protein BIU82_04300 [Arthrobacter sp. SW1]
MKSSSATPFRRLLAAITTAVLAATAFVTGAVPAQAAGFTIQGTITGKATASATPAVLGDVWVGAYTNDWQADNVGGMWTGADGKFSFTVPAEGSYKLWISCGACSNTYADEWYNNHTHSESADPVTVTAAAPTATANVELSAYGKVSGRVTDKNGLPITTPLEVSASPSEGGQVVSATPDANGYYTLAKVQPGKIELRVTDESGKHLYVNQQWNGSAGVEGHYDGFTMPTGAVLSNVNFALNPQTVFEAAVTDPAGVPIPNVAYGPQVYNEATGKWDGPQYGPLLSDDAGKVYWDLTVGKKYRFCFSDNYYEIPREYRYVAECYDNVPDLANAKIVTPTTAGERITATVQLAVAGKGLTQGDAFAYGGNQPGQTVTVDPGAWGPAPVTLSYQWTRYKDGTETAIAGATSADYVLTEADRDHYVSVKITGSKDGYVTSSSWTGIGKVGAPAITSSKPLTLEGTPAVGNTLTADFGTLTPAPEYGAMYEWYVDGVRDERSYENTFTLTPADAGKKVTVRVSAHDWPTEPYYAQATSAPVAAGTLTAPTPTITGTAKVGYTLTANAGTWGPAPVTLAYQWFRSGVAITGATAATYVQTSADLGKTMTVQVTGTKTGYTTAARTSAATAAVAAGTLTAPAPTITGTKKVGYRLTANAGTWGPAPVTLAYQWFRSGVAITGATASTYTLTASDLGKTMTVRVTGSKAGYTTVAKTSAATTAVVAGTLTAPTPTITGTKKVGYTLTANPGTWGPAPVTLRYQWFRGTTAISGAVYQTYKLTTTDRGKQIRVRVTGSKSGYTTVSKYSAYTVAIV